MPKLSITKEEWKLIISITAAGFVWSIPEFIQYIQTVGNVTGLIIRYVALFGFAFLILNGKSMNINRFKIKRFGLRETTGLIMIYYAFAVAWNWINSCWSDIVIKGVCNMPQMVMVSEDGVLWTLLEPVVPSAPMLRLVVYVVMPFLLTLGGAILVTRRKINLMR